MKKRVTDLAPPIGIEDGVAVRVAAAPFSEPACFWSPWPQPDRTKVAASAQPSPIAESPLASVAMAARPPARSPFAPTDRTISTCMVAPDIVRGPRFRQAPARALGEAAPGCVRYPRSDSSNCNKEPIMTLPMSILCRLATAAIVIACAAGGSQAQELGGSALVGALRQGGYV